jgi:SAM-dependent methyltransferase
VHVIPRQPIISKLYRELATWWPLLSPPEDYADEAAFFGHVLAEVGLPLVSSLLELGCGGGSNAFYLKQIFTHVTLTDLSPDMLAVSRTLNPECEHVEGDMRTIRLGRVFDVVFIHDAIDYMTTLQALGQALETAFVHCKPGGLVLLLPDYVRETFQPSTDYGGRDADARGLRYLEWTYDPDENDTTYTTEYVYVLRDGTQPTRVEHEQHTCGLFSRGAWLGLLCNMGFQPEIVQDPYDRELFLGRKSKD